MSDSARARQRSTIFARLVAVFACATLGTAADGQTIPRLEVDVRALTSGNPFLLSGGNTDAGLVEITARPGIHLTTSPGTTFDLSAVATGRRYTRRYGGFVVGRIDAVAERRDSERLSYRAAAGFSRDLAVDVLTSTIESAADPMRIRSSVTGSASLTYRPDGRTWIIPEINFEQSRFGESALFADTRTITGSLSYRRRTGPLTTAGVRAMASFSRVEPGFLMNTQALYGVLERRLAASWPLTVELGAERVSARSEPILGVVVTQPARTRLSGRVQLCREAPGPEICAGASLDSEVSGLGGLQRRAVGHARITYRLAERTTLSAEAQYQRTMLQDTVFPDLDAIRVVATVERQIQPGLRLGAALQYLRRRLLDGTRIGAGFAGIQATWSPRQL